MVLLVEKYKIIMVLEFFNFKVVENMKGYFGYMGDYIDYCIEIIKVVGFLSLKLLFDVYYI